VQDKVLSPSLITAPLEQALAPTSDPPPVWCARMDRALADVEQEADSRGLLKVGRLGEVSDLIPSPGLDRRLGRLRQALGGLAQEASAIRQDIRREAERAPMGPASLGRFHRRAAALLLGLEEYELEEARLILESVNTDIGAGD
jgi:hypothetical protein